MYALLWNRSSKQGRCPLFEVTSLRHKTHYVYLSHFHAAKIRYAIPITVHQITMARGKGQQTSGGTKKEKKETRQERRARLEAEAAAREVSE